MEPVPSDYKTMPTFGPNSSMASPDAGTLDTGYASGETFPVTEANYLFNRITNNNNVSERLATSITTELDYLLTQNGITPNGSLTTQINQAVNAAISTSVSAEAALARNADNLTSGTVALARIPNTLTGKDADTVDGYHAISFPLTYTYFLQTTNLTIPSMSVGGTSLIFGTAGVGSWTMYLPAGGTYSYVSLKSIQSTNSWLTAPTVSGGGAMGNFTDQCFFIYCVKRLT
jgi:hypothetical protein